jgi:hypothetical protein
MHLTDADKISHDRLLSLVSYDPATGLFTNLVRRSMSHAGTVLRPRKRVGICIDGLLYRTSHLVWFYVHGTWPVGMIDHINNNPEDNRICNLREATKQQNGQNRAISKRNKSGFKGVTRVTEANRWQAHIKVNDKKIYLGSFLTPEEAYEAYISAAQQHFGEYARFV